MRERTIDERRGGGAKVRGAREIKCKGERQIARVRDRVRETESKKNTENEKGEM